MTGKNKNEKKDGDSTIYAASDSDGRSEISRGITIALLGVDRKEIKQATYSGRDDMESWKDWVNGIFMAVILPKFCEIYDATAGMRHADIAALDSQLDEWFTDKKKRARSISASQPFRGTKADVRHMAQWVRFEEEDIPEVKKESFRYPGPRPRTRESAIISLADAVESASRSLQKPTPKKIEELIEELVRDRLYEGQLDNAALTLRDLATIKESFAITLRSMLHSRIAYPKISKDENGEETPEPLPPTREESPENKTKIIRSAKLEDDRKERAKGKKKSKGNDRNPTVGAA